MRLLTKDGVQSQRMPSMCPSISLVKDDALEVGLWKLLPFRGRHLCDWLPLHSIHCSTPYKLGDYEWELIELFQAIHGCWPYLLGRAFTIRIDYYNLNSSLINDSWWYLNKRLIKLFWFDFTTKFWLGRLNIKVHALFRRDADTTPTLYGLILQIFTILSDLRHDIDVSPSFPCFMNAYALWSWPPLELCPWIDFPWASGACVSTNVHTSDFQQFIPLKSGFERCFMPWHSVQISMSLVIFIGSKTWYVIVWSDNITRWRHSWWSDLLQNLLVPSYVYGVIYPCISLRPCLVSMERLWFLYDFYRFSDYSHFIPLSQTYTTVLVAKVVWGNCVFP